MTYQISAEAELAIGKEVNKKLSSYARWIGIGSLVPIAGLLVFAYQSFFNVIEDTADRLLPGIATPIAQELLLRESEGMKIKADQLQARFDLIESNMPKILGDLGRLQQRIELIATDAENSKARIDSVSADTITIGGLSPETLQALARFGQQIELSGFADQNARLIEAEKELLELQGKIDGLQTNFSEAKKVLQTELRSSTNMTLVNGKCPPGMNRKGLIGVIMANDGYNDAIGSRGAGYNSSWTWNHPTLCVR